MKVVVLHNAVSQQATPDEQDVLVQVDCVLAALGNLGHAASALPATLDLESVRRQLAAASPDVVFNLVEALAGSDRLMSFAPALLDVIGMPYTGVPTEGMSLSAHKLLAKQRLHAAGLPTPAWETVAGSRYASMTIDGQGTLAPPYIVKAIFEHASFGMDDEAVVSVAGRTAQEHLHERQYRFGRDFFAEAYVEGREFNLSVLAGPHGPEVLPPAEIDFSAFPEGKPRIVGYAAKWHSGSFEFDNTPRTFDSAPEDARLLDEIRRLALECWRVFGLRGYARVDFRIDAAGQPWILEINPNPCLSPDAGFFAAVERAGLTFPKAVARILADATR